MEMDEVSKYGHFLFIKCFMNEMFSSNGVVTWVLYVITRIFLKTTAISSIIKCCVHVFYLSFFKFWIHMRKVADHELDQVCRMDGWTKTNSCIVNGKWRVLKLLNDLITLWPQTCWLIKISEEFSFFLRKLII